MVTTGPSFLTLTSSVLALAAGPAILRSQNKKFGKSSQDRFNKAGIQADILRGLLKH